MIYKLLIGLLFFMMPSVIVSQTVLEASKISLNLTDGVEVNLYQSKNNSSAYYYLPTNFRISTKNNHPQFSFTPFYEGESKKVEGAIMHLLFTWGLDANQLAKATNLLQEKVDSNAVIYGAMNVEMVLDNSWTIYGAADNSLANLLNKGIQSNSNIPTTNGGKWAASFRFDAIAAKEMMDCLSDKKILKNTFIQFNYTYQLMVKEGYFGRTKIYPLQLESSIYDLIGLINSI